MNQSPISFSYKHDATEGECPHCKYPKASFFHDLRDDSPGFECDKCSGALDYFGDD